MRKSKVKRPSHPAKKSMRPVRSSEVSATSAMLYEMEERLVPRMDAGFERLSGEISGVKFEVSGLKSGLSGVKSDLVGLKSELSGVKSDLSGLKSEVSGVKSDLSSIRSELHRVALLVEEQNARNKYALDGYAQLYDLIKAAL